MNPEIRVRFAPSPTGLLHLGGVRTALYNYLFAKQNNGTFILRIEDTDQSRYVEGSVENLIQSLRELGIDYDEGPNFPQNKENLNSETSFLPISQTSVSKNESYFQSERLDLYQKHVDELLEKGLAYRCYCTKEDLEAMRNEQTQRGETTRYNGKCRNLNQETDNTNAGNEVISTKVSVIKPSVIRMKMPENRIFEFTDMVRGVIQISSNELEDQVILKADGFPTYHLAAVVDDHYMNISHVLRGEEWLYSTPKHEFLYESLGWKPPVWVHLPLLLNTDKTKLSKRHGDFSVANYLKMGYLKEAIINFVALLGWHSSDDKELYTIQELEKEFSLQRITKSGAVFDITKLDWMNGWYIRNLPLENIAELCKQYFEKENIDISNEVKYLKVINRARDQITKLTEIVEQAKVFYSNFEVSIENLEIVQSENSQKVLQWFIQEIENNYAVVANNQNPYSEMLKRASENLGIKGKNLFFPLRIALFGDCHGPDIPMLIDIFGIDESLEKLKKMIF
ncbi:MAG: glutamate--tRNA ligase [Candidatus Cloacimonetes bacterium]|nr:glutamate--tRNA ligase [Candidatus Cloacimonadota bacterium]